jgi:hypothetical protein
LLLVAHGCAKFTLTAVRDIVRIVAMQPHEFEDAKLLWKMFYAEQCFKHTRAAAEHILKEKLEESSALSYPLITAVHVSYGKPFRKSRGVGQLEEEIIPPQHLDLHRLLLKHRDQTFAHTDATGFELPDCGPANQVRFVRFAAEIRLCGTEFQTLFPLMPDVIDLCGVLQEKASDQTVKLFNTYCGQVPEAEGEYAVNVHDHAGDFFLRQQPIFL